MVLSKHHLGPDFASVAPSISGQVSAEIQVAPAVVDLKEATREFQRSLIERALTDNDGNWAVAARSRYMHRSNFHHLAVRLGLK